MVVGQMAVFKSGEADGQIEPASTKAQCMREEACNRKPSTTADKSLEAQ